MPARPLNFEEARELAQLAYRQNMKFVEGKVGEWRRYLFGGPGPTAGEKGDNIEWYYRRVNFWMKQVHFI